MERLLEQEEDELEFSVCLPSPALEPSALLTGGVTEPVVFLLGPEGGNDSALCEYSWLYEERGCVTIRYTAPIHCLYNREETRPLAARLASLLEELCLLGSPVFVHSLGCGGAGVYQYLGEELERRGHSLAGVVFDSGPEEFGWVRQYQTIHSSLSVDYPNPILRHASSLLLLASCTLQSLALQLSTLLCLPLPAPVPSPAHHVARELEPPALFLYSPDDAGVEGVAAARQETGGRVRTVHWEDSSHLAHLATHREAYTCSLLSFLRDCLHLE